MKVNGLLAWVLAAVLLSAWCTACSSPHQPVAPQRIRTTVAEFRIGPYPAVVAIARQQHNVDVDLLVAMPIDDEHPIDPSRILISLVLKDGSALTNPALLVPTAAPPPPPPPIGPPGIRPEIIVISRWYLAKFGSKVKMKQIKAVSISIDGRPLTFPVTLRCTTPHLALYRPSWPAARSGTRLLAACSGRRLLIFHLGCQPRKLGSDLLVRPDKPDE
jgi:hypothetical protein